MEAMKYKENTHNQGPIVVDGVHELFVSELDVIPVLDSDVITFLSPACFLFDTLKRRKPREFALIPV